MGRTVVTPATDMTGTILSTCVLAQGDGRGRGWCSWCGADIPRNRDGSIPKARRWCSSTCSQAFSTNHSWAWARPAAVRRDGRKCTTCGMGEWDGKGARPCTPGTYSWHLEAQLGTAPRPHVSLEVNHVHALADAGVKGYTFGCHHHLDNLETLCHDCHVAVTNEQRRARKAARVPR